MTDPQKTILFERTQDMKKTLSIIALTALVLVLALSCACSGKGPKEVTKSAAEIYTAVAAAGKLGTMTPVPATDLSDVYGIDSSKLAEFAWYVSENPSLNADEVGIFKVNDEAYAASLEQIMKDRIARQLNVAESYSPDEAAKLKAAQVISVGNWVYFCVGGEGAAMMEVLRNEIG